MFLITPLGFTGVFTSFFLLFVRFFHSSLPNISRLTFSNCLT